MDKMLYVAMTGAKQAMVGQAIRSNNLANVSTTSFKKDFEQFRSMPVYGEHFPSRAFAMTESPGINFDEGSLMQTGRELDVAIKSDGWFVVLDDQGNEAFTRNGNFSIDKEGYLKTQSGHILMGNAGALIIPPNEKMEIGEDGVISIRGLGQAPNSLTEIDRMKLVRPPLSELEKGEDGLFRRKDRQVEDPDASVQLVTGMLEGSNVNAVEEMIAVMSHQRQFDMHIKLMKNAEENDKAVDRLMQIS